jgi:hypothetical membrane protein
MRTSTVFRLTRWAFGVATVLEGIAMVLYPGGSVLRPDTRGYSFFQNSLSDLGSTVAWSGRANPGVSCHIAASVLLVLAGCACFVPLLRLYRSSPVTTWITRTAGVLAVLAGAGLVGAALAPQDRYLSLHRQCTLFAVWAFPFATALLTLATALNPLLRPRVPIAWLVLTLTVIAWASMMFFARPTTEPGLAIPVTLQKIVAMTLVATLVLQGYEAERAAGRGGG